MDNSQKDGTDTVSLVREVHVDKVMNRLRDMGMSALLWQIALPAMIANAVSAVTSSFETTTQKAVLGNIGISSTALIQPLELILTMYISVGLSGGVVSFISPALGQNNIEAAQRFLMHYMILYFIVIVLVPLVTLPYMDKLVVMLGAPEGSATATYAAQYGYIIFSLGTIVYFINYGFGNILRALNRSVFNSIKQIVSSCLQLLFVYLFYNFLVKTGTVQMYTNAASPVLANFATAVAVIILFTPFKKILKTIKLKFSWKALQPFSLKILGLISYYAIPDFLAQIYIPVTVLVGNAILTRLADSQSQSSWNITVLGITYKMSPLVAISNQSFGFAFGPAFGYAIGARNWKRAREAMKLIFLWMSGLGLLFYIAMNLSVEAFSISLMEGYQPMSDDVTFGFRCYHSMLPFLPCFLCMNDISQMEQKPGKSILIQISRILFVIIFECIFSYALKSYKGVYYGYIVGDLCASIVGVIAFIERYITYGKLERGEITVQKARIGDTLSGSFCFRNQPQRAPKQTVEAVKLQQQTLDQAVESPQFYDNKKDQNAVPITIAQ